MLIAWAFIRRDFLTATSYRVSFAMEMAGAIGQLVLFYFIAQAFGGAVGPALQGYGGSYFAFLLVGLAFSSFLGLGLHSVTDSIREGQGDGTLELMLLSPARLSTILAGSSLWGFLFTSLRVGLYLLVGAAFFGVRLSGANPLSVLLTLVLSLVCFGSLGLISASFVMVLKRGDPIVWAFGTLSSLLGGIYYPVAVLPDWLQWASKLLPITYALDGLRLGLLQGAPPAAILPSLAALLSFAALLLPIGLWSFRLALRRAKIDGSLSQY